MTFVCAAFGAVFGALGMATFVLLIAWGAEEGRHVILSRVPITVAGVVTSGVAGACLGARWADAIVFAPLRQGLVRGSLVGLLALAAGVLVWCAPKVPGDLKHTTFENAALEGAYAYVWMPLVTSLVMTAIFAIPVVLFSVMAVLMTREIADAS